jgi:hypothetical protein
VKGKDDNLFANAINPDRRNDWSDILPDVRDGLTRPQRIVMYEIYKAQKESGREFVPTVMLYGRVLEHINISEHELNQILQSLGVMGDAPAGKAPQDQ